MNSKLVSFKVSTWSKISHDKKFFHAQKIPITKITCPKPHVQNFHAQDHMSKKFSMTKTTRSKISYDKKKFPMTEITCPKNSHAPKKSQCPTNKKKNQCPTKFYHNQNFWHVHTQLPKFSHNHAIKKNSRMTMSMYNHENSYISKIITKIFFMIQHHMPNKNIFVAKITYP